MSELRVDLREGRTAWVRPIRSLDATELQRAFALLSDLSRYQRFMTGTPWLTDRLADHFSDIDHVDHEALVALPEKRSRTIVGVARYIRHRDAPTDADLAITVADEWHGYGLGTTLLGLLSDRARQEDVRRFTVDMLADNDAIRALVRRAGGTTEPPEAATVFGRIELFHGAPEVPAALLLKAAASKEVVPVPHPLGEVIPDLRGSTRAVLVIDE